MSVVFNGLSEFLFERVRNIFPVDRSLKLMSLTINHNLMAMNSARNLDAHYGALSVSTRRLSSGLRIGTAADDAAGLAIRELMRSEIKSLHQGIRNANDAISMVQTADGALQVIDEKLIRMKELAMQASTGTYNADQRAIIDSEYQAMAREIQRISDATDFNGVYLLNGNLSGTHDGSGLQSTGGAKVHFGTGNDCSEDYYYININSSKIEEMFDPDDTAVGEYQPDANMFFERTSGDVLVNSTTDGNQRDSNLASLEDGNVVVVWNSENQDGSGWGVYGQVMDQGGEKVGNEFQVNSETANNQDEPSVASLNDGGFAVTWTSDGQDGSGTGIYSKVYNADGSLRTDEFRVNTTTANDQYQSDITTTSTGYFVTWTSNGQDGSDDGIYGKYLDSNGNTLVDEFQVNTTTALDQRYSRASELDNGNVAVAWFAPDADGWGVYAQVVDKQGNLVGSETRVNTDQVNSQNFIDIAAIDGGRFAVAWNDINNDGTFDAKARIAESDVSFVTGELTINDVPLTGQTWPKLTRLEGGGFLAAYRDSGGTDGDSWGVFGQLYTADGVAVDENFVINQTTTGSQILDDVVGLKGGGFFASYFTDDGLDPSSNGIGASIYLPVVSVATQARAQDSLDAINEAIVYKDKIRANLGAMQNRLENTISNLEIQAENLQASESRISDVDVAQEMTEFVRRQILTQSAVAMLAQANSLPRMAMQLIGG
jgi:flagellin-like hook-associated protein FlgL